MKKLLIITFILSFSLLISACTKELQTTISTTSTLQDAVKPKINITYAAKKIEIRAGQEVDLLDGITVIDNVDKNLRDKIVIVKEDFDVNIPGIYEIYYFVQDTAGNSADSITKTITVLDTKVIAEFPIYNGKIENEAPLPVPDNCFGGAWYHKVVTAKDYWLGIEGTITLPFLDINRYQGTNTIITDPEFDIMPDLRNLDNPSIYMGGKASSESDAGLTLSQVKNLSGDISRGGVAFRPFWRYITSINKDEGIYDLNNGRRYSVSCSNGGNNCIASYHPNYNEYYYLPGDKIRMIIYSPEKNYIQLQIQVIEKSTLPYSINLRKEMKWSDPLDFKSPPFYSPGHNTGIKAEFKRVNAIDQVANEGGLAHMTTTHVKEALWHESYLYRTINGVVSRVPMLSSRVNVMNCPNPDAFILETTPELASKGGEKVQIKPEGISNILSNRPIAITYRKED